MQSILWMDCILLYNEVCMTIFRGDVMKKTKQQKQLMRIRIFAITGIVIVIAFVGLMLKSIHDKEENNDNHQVEIIEDQVQVDGIELRSLGLYSGNFVEDGSDAAVEKVGSVTIENTSHRWLEYAEILVTTSKETYHFTISAIPPQSKVIALEKDRKKLDLSKGYEVEIKNTLFYKETPTLKEKMFEIEARDGQIIVTNISEKDCSGTIYVYYKTKVNGVYVGGITYRVKIDGGLDAGVSGQIYAGHYGEETSEILYITYVE